MTDTLIRIIRDTVIVKPDAMEIMEKTHSYYNDAWTKMLLYSSILGIVITIVAGLIAFAVPYWLKRQQEEQIKISTAELEQSIRLKTEAAIKDLIIDNNRQIETRFRNEVDSTQKYLEGKMHFIWATDAGKRGDYAQAYLHTIWTVHFFLTMEKNPQTINNMTLLLKAMRSVTNLSELAKEAKAKNFEIDALSTLLAFREKYDSETVLKGYVNDIINAINI